MANFNLLSNINQKYLFYLFVTYQSVLDSLEDNPSNPDDKIIFHVMLDEDVDDTLAQKYADIFSKFNESSKVSFTINFYRVDNTCFKHCNVMQRDGRFSFTAYYRLLFAQVIPEDVDRILYFDTDILVRADIRQVFAQHPAQDEVLYATSEPGYLVNCENPCDPEPYSIRQAFDPNKEPYRLAVRNCIQSGVMLINVQQWRKQNIEQKSIQTAYTWQVKLHDQDILSMVCTGKVAPLSWEWNINAIQFWIDEFGLLALLNRDFTLEELPINDAPSLEQLRLMCQNPKIVHFANVFKPWELTHKLSKAKLENYKVWMPFMTQWLQNYGRFAEFFKIESHKEQ